MNDTLTTAAIALGNVGFTFLLLILVAIIYAKVYSEYKIFDFDRSSPLTYIFAFLLYDFLYYWNHRFHHLIGLLWVDHVVHHSSEELNFGITIRLSYFVELTMWLSFIPMAFIGIPPEIFLLASYTELVWAHLLHTTSLKDTKWAEKMINTPSLHRVHHARNPIYIDRNFGGILIIWDRIFGTYQAELEKEPPSYGINEPCQSFSPVVINTFFLKTIAGKIGCSRTVREVLLSVFGPPSWLPSGAEKESFYPDPAGVSSEGIQKRDPVISQHAKSSTIIRFAILVIVFGYLMSFFGSLSPVPIAILSFLFFWLSHYNGKMLDGCNLGWTFEVVAQMAYLSLIGWGLVTNQPTYSIVSAVAVSFVSLIGYVIYRIGQPQGPISGLQMTAGS